MLVNPVYFALVVDTHLARSRAWGVAATMGRHALGEKPEEEMRASQPVPRTSSIHLDEQGRAWLARLAWEQTDHRATTPVALHATSEATNERDAGQAGEADAIDSISTC
jgi:hypothetical protein